MEQLRPEEKLKVNIYSAARGISHSVVAVTLEDFNIAIAELTLLGKL